MYDFDVIKMTAHVNDVDARIAMIAEAIAVAQETEGPSPGEYSVTGTLRTDLAKLKVRKMIVERFGKPPAKRKPVRKVVSEDDEYA